MSEKIGVNAYIVGGYVRDKLLNLESDDIDITVEGDGIKFAFMLNEILNGEMEVHDKFETAKIKTKDFELDIVSARKERYERPGMLPVVQRASLADDIKRRDFTINMLALDVKTNQIIDIYNGGNDIKNKLIRVVHDKSFVDDPTRIFRAIRYSGRLGFKIEQHTERLLRKSISDGDIFNVSADRIMNEIYLILKEKKPEPIVELMKYYQINKELFCGIKINATNLNTSPKEGDILLYRFLLLFYNATKEDADCLIRKYNLKREYLSGLSDILNIKMNMSKLNENASIFNTLKDKRIEAISAVHIMEDLNTKQAIEKYYDMVKLKRLEINGDDIKRLGLQPSPIYKQILDKILLDKISGKIKDREDEIRSLLHYVEKVKRGEKI
ncbi:MULTISPECIES: CCA tRNA nucleotidyltransferase [Thermoanaerobacterium]|uniref:Polynucleotide adenylyltransferase region n=2 Tax=Thermoanaerobacterium TaxID=28895 RepID=W9EHV4_9THEO|nr:MULTISPECIES: CCA tRNA nucleotidyltransferase [Thermoanaerobacterium]AFK86902.1 Polynucleotide adenylyltransferase region [Thermoanaerobacterium saccharolyticum JW/SL-YS485]ETO39289.1 Polynucleotide adenylyltransferase region [Thermoanaerobacterium aotearoense SCUT27]